MTAGQPFKFQSVEELQASIDEYFDYCDNRIKRVYSKKLDAPIEMIDPAPYTILGLCRALGTNRQTLLNYEKSEGYEQFFDTVKAAKLRVGEDVETRSLESNAAGPIFNLKNNFGHKDSQEHDHNIKGELKIVASKTDVDL